MAHALVPGPTVRQRCLHEHQRRAGLARHARAARRGRGQRVIGEQDVRREGPQRSPGAGSVLRSRALRLETHLARTWDETRRRAESTHGVPATEQLAGELRRVGAPLHTQLRSLELEGQRIEEQCDA